VFRTAPALEGELKLAPAPTPELAPKILELELTAPELIFQFGSWRGSSGS